MILGLKFMASTCENSKNSAVIADCKCMSAERLRAAGLRPTRQRVALADLIFERGDRHLTAEALQEDASANGVSCSLATIYNTLHQFTDAGMLRVLSLDSNKTFFDTNVSDHHHFIVEGSDEVLDIKSGDINVVGLPDVPEGMEIANVDVIVRLRPIAK
jgi:Fur family iron response transcriptional regulator